jgi:hypothetical protein
MRDLVVLFILWFAKTLRDSSSGVVRQNSIEPVIL